MEYPRYDSPDRPQPTRQIITYLPGDLAVMRKPGEDLPSDEVLHQMVRESTICSLMLWGVVPNPLPVGIVINGEKHMGDNRWEPVSLPPNVIHANIAGMGDAGR